MALNKESAVEEAKKDLSKRLSVAAGDIKVTGVTEKDFPDMSLGAPTAGEMSAQMISSGWRIGLSAGSGDYEYRADKYQLRLYNFKGHNYVIK